MSTNEIICLSSEDEDNDQNKIKNTTKVRNSTTNGGKNSTQNTKKRITPITVASEKPKQTKLISSVKPKIEDVDNDEAIEVIGVVTMKRPFTKPLSFSSSSTNKCDEEDDDDVVIPKVPKLEDKPLLIVKEKHPVHATNGRQDIFSMFLSQCLQRDKSTDMRKIVEKLKRKYEQLDPSYAHSEEFEDLLNEKRNCLMYENNQVYKHIAEVYEVMKNRKLGKNGDLSISNEVNLCGSLENEDSEETRKINYKIRSIEKIMSKVENRIKKYEEAEVDFDDESDSTFLITERYKKRMVDLYEKWCELTGNHKDAGRSYLRPIYLKLTGIVTVDQTINSFINSKLHNKKKAQTTPTANNLVFPDYVDILKLIQTHNEKKKLGMDAKAERSMAKQAFIKLGEYLKLARQKDFYDTFSLMYDQSDDPAMKHEELKIKLRENRELGEKKLNAIFDEYSKKQDKARSLGIDNSDDDSKTDDEEDEAEEDQITDDTISGDDGEHVENNDSDTTVHQSDISSVDDDQKNDGAMIVNQNEVKIDNVNEICVVSASDGITESKPCEKSEIKNISAIPSLNTDLSVTSENNIINESHSKIILKTDEVKTAITPTPMNTANANLSKDIQDVNGVIESTNVEGTTEILNSEDCEEEKPLLKLRSFAKPPRFWQNSQESKNQDSDKNIEVESEVIEIIDLDISEEKQDNINKEIQKKKKVDNTAIKKMTTNHASDQATPCKLVPLKQKKKDITIFKRFVRIPAVKLTTANSNIQLSKVSIVNTDAIKQCVVTNAQQNRFVPLSAIDIRNKKSIRPIEYIVNEKKSSEVSPVNEKQRNITATNSNVSQNLRINPVTTNVQLPTKTNKPPLILNLKNHPVIVQNTQVKYLELIPQKIVNPIVKQQPQNIENMKITIKIPEYNKSTTSPEKSSKLIPS
ncbi:hypothetical protein PV327_005456 [Microctonus hyperodae]|uniref:Daxx histone-binding domain-containing protein n=1 Tax=Microctonus hyperodae TaxID=165561 RepID=A0AA39G1P1_MICHY|nr:hypothetical protein PV327_005456 [Microctonus hyperodae]